MFMGEEPQRFNREHELKGQKNEQNLNNKNYQYMNVCLDPSLFDLFDIFISMLSKN